jgi:hypothetical protein
LAGAGFGMVLGTQNWAPGKQHFHRALLATLQPQDVSLLLDVGVGVGLGWACDCNDFQSWALPAANMPGSHSCHVRVLLPSRPGLRGCVRVLLLVTSGSHSCHVRAFIFASRSHSCHVRVPMVASGSHCCHVRVPLLPRPGPNGCVRVPLLPRPGPNGCVRVPLLPRPGPHGCTWVPLLPRPGPHPGSHPIWLLKIYEGARWVFPVARHARHCSQGGVLKGGVSNEVGLTEIDWQSNAYANPTANPLELQTAPAPTSSQQQNILWLQGGRRVRGKCCFAGAQFWVPRTIPKPAPAKWSSMVWLGCLEDDTDEKI